ncbi:TPA: ethanolamine ammonia-lyase reactivating factor EutA [Escherichia coli]
MGINEIIMYIMMFFMLIAAVDRILSQFGGSARFLGKFGKSIEGSGGQFEEGFMAMGALGLAMVGMTALAPVLAHVLGPVIIPVYEMLGANPSMFAGTLLACDMGGFFLAKELAGGDVAAWLYSGLILGSMMGPTIVFSIPVALGIIEPSDRRYLALSQSLGDFVVASAGPHLESVIAGHGAGAQTLSEQRLCRVLNIDIGGGTANYALFDAGKISGTACLNVGGRLLETDSQGRVVYAHKPGQMIVDECFGAGTDARSLTGAQLVQVTRRMAALIVEVIDGTLSPLAQALMQTGLLPAGVTPEIITLSGGVGECYRHQPADPFCFADIGPLLATALHDHPRLREMNVQFPAQTVRATVIGAGAHTLSLSGSTIWLEGVQLPLRNLPVAIPIDETDLVSAWQQALLQLDLDPKTDAYVLALPASLPVRYAAVLTVINALVDFVARFPNPHPLLVVAGQDFGKALGMLLRPQLQQLPLAVIDEVIVRAGDYIDIGTPLFGGSVVPVTVKSLAFPS